MFQQQGAGQRTGTETEAGRVTVCNTGGSGDPAPGTDPRAPSLRLLSTVLMYETVLWETFKHFLLLILLP